MVDILNYENILKKNYSFYKSKYFFGIGDEDYSTDPIRIVKLLYILISFILNLLIIISILKKKGKKISIAVILTGNILIINFIHTFSYSFEWILKEESEGFNNKTVYLGKDGYIYNTNYTKLNENTTYYEVGGLLINNLENLGCCKTQGFFLIFSAISQDILINLFFFILNQPKIPSKKIVIILVIIIGYCIPLIISFIYLLINGIGINDKFCYIKKFYIDENNSYNPYKYYQNFPLLIYILYGFRTTNLSISLFLLCKIIKYVRANKLKRLYILKSSTILVIQVITILMGLIYRIGCSINENFSRNFTNIFLCVNTVDGILFPLSYSLSNSIYSNLFNRNSSKDSIESLSDEQDDECNNDNAFNISRSNSEKNFAMVDINDNNNFDLSYI